MIGDELQPLVHRGHLLPGHRFPRERDARTVECHPSCRNNLLPINPVYTPQVPNVALHADGRISDCGLRPHLMIGARR